MRLRSLVLLAAAVGAAWLPAQGRRGRGRPPLPIFEALDIDGDQRISGEEMDEAVRSLLTLDKDGDGNLTSDELTPEPRGGRGGFGGPGGPGGMFGTHPLMAALDKDGDGELFEDEVTDAPRSLDRLDLDDDDVLTERELEGPGRGGGFPGGFRGGRDRGAGGGGYDGVPKPEQLKPEDGVATVPDRETFQRLSYQGQEVMIDTHLADQEFVKFQIEDAAGASPQLYFMNTKTHRAHPMFMRVIGVTDRRGRGGGGGGDQGGDVRMRGVLVYRPTLMSPSGKPGLYTFEFEPNDAYEYDLIRVAFDLLQQKSAELRGNLAYNLLPRARQQWATEQERYVEGKLPVFHPDDVYGDVAFLPLHPAVLFGRLRVMEPGERPTSRDVVIYRSLPNEMPRVAGVLTACRQTPLSHVNLRAVQDDVPNAFVHGVADDPKVRALVGKFVRYAVTDGGYELREASQQEVDAHFEDLRPALPQVPPRDLSVREVRAFDEIGFDDSAAFGVKAANLATLRTFGFDAERTPDGYALPFAFYD
ncbi:MAG: hypothetical protein KAI24_02580, partial [Planctomycetes bacterium]|nr:hypothetical protein [Planctomycetota bacterium]